MRPPILFPLFAPLQSLPGIGPRGARAAEALFGKNIAALLCRLPSGLIDRSRRPSVSDLRPGQNVTLNLIIDRHETRPHPRAPYRVFCHDDTGAVSLVFFQKQTAYLPKLMPQGARRFVSGTVEFFNNKPQIAHPDHILSEEEFARQPSVEPVYPLTAGVTRRALRRAMDAALSRIPDLPEWLSPQQIKTENWPSWKTALLCAHRPQSDSHLKPSSPPRARLAYDELLANQLALSLMRSHRRQLKGQSFNADPAQRSAVLKTLPFRLTDAQKRVLAEIDADMNSPGRMLRLLQGDVGSGKTIVAFLAMLNATANGAQAAIMAPTEILARQHAQTLKPLCETVGLSLAVLTGREKTAPRRQILQDVAAGNAHILAGTHSLFQKTVTFHNLGLAVIDEQHRFGVHQRLQLSQKNPKGNADVLVMTATPIPRSLTLTAYGGLNVSRLDQKPAGRKPILTRALPTSRMPEVIAAINRALKQNQRVFWICPLIGEEGGEEGQEDDDAHITAARKRQKHLSQNLIRPAGLVHGRMTREEKDAAVNDFRSGKTPLLTATTVIEVGVDVPDAAVIVIEHAERFGLAQLHQLRGRVGRSDKKSACLLLYQHPLGENARRRIDVLRKSNDGFFIAEEDLRLRGAGELLGTRQSGMPAFRIADPVRHAQLLADAHQDAQTIVKTDPTLSSKRGSALRTLLYLFERDEAVRLLRSG